MSSVSGMSDTAPCPPSPIADNPSALPSPTPSLLQSVALLACSLHTSPWMPAVVLYYSTVRLKCLFYFLFVMYYLCEKYYKLITVQYYIADCVSWVPRLTLWINWTYGRSPVMEVICMSGTYWIFQRKSLFNTFWNLVPDMILHNTS